MKLARQKVFAMMSSNFGLAKRIGEKLDRDRYEDYEISNRIPNDSISITADLTNLEIYIPEDMEYSQYEIDDFIRDLVPFIRTSITEDRNLYVMTLSKPLTEEQYYKLVKYIIEDQEFCVIVDK